MQHPQTNPQVNSGIQSRDARGRVKDAPSGHWVYRVLPHWLWPYAQLARWDRPIGWQLLLWPCWWSAALVAGAGAKPGDGAWAVLPSFWHLFLFLIGAIAMRGSGCTYNDLVDQDIDDKVDRTRSRPLPSGQVTRGQAKLFLVLQALVGLVVVLQFNWFSIGLGIFSLLIVAAYPFMKRITDWPQFVLGLAFSWGALMGWGAVEGSLSLAPVLLYIGAILWTIGYDTIYAHQDKEDDALVGVRSTARLFGKHTKTALMILYGGAIGFFAAAFAVAEVPMPALAGLLAAGVHLYRQIIVLDIDNPDQCLKLFKSNNIVGWLIFLGLVFGSLWVAVKPLV
ncbi:MULTISPECIES: 4-hydroxybenzoate octaprenyltransferase [Brucella/Ochrobactrum group]|jgi:4-hydroxybenzoate polyprenyltransferase|uniref:4-hydroxybenzoate octaprenyltransferase n=1 Tax=Brucella/Ochrobactrum group TaxID=2826938 RepID=UPI000EFD2424|nr:MULTISPECIES: 4-hydroxybenzoate octaprenyltransferase [Brucella/Ochrobactrum group]KAB2682197.1 4-hydroxybenzoate octaprenyltransferase [Brucella pseudintermedia]TWH02217.1 4-hydroxybenzoate polyprenyltransferase [Ochrobactrum sp. J50]WPM80564.1 4-hydroxybenzoate octaprenyltransferase [Brucella pseudintermedia]